MNHPSNNIFKIHEDPFVSPDGLMLYAGLYLGKTDLKNPFASPLYADFEGFPPLCIQVGSTEILLDDATRLAKRAK